jgi:hypothetical protein
MPLPTSRNTTYAAGSQVLSDDLNDLQDCIIQDAHDERTIVIPCVSGNGDGAIFDAPGRVEADPNDSSVDLYFPIVLPVGSRITNWVLRCRDSSGVSFLAQLVRLLNDGTMTAHSNSDSSGGAAADEDVTPGTFAAYTVVATEAVGIRVTPNSNSAGTNFRFYYLTVTYDRPLV